jgi:hypothetical protein
MSRTSGLSRAAADTVNAGSRRCVSASLSFILLAIAQFHTQVEKVFHETKIKKDKK